MPDVRGERAGGIHRAGESRWCCCDLQGYDGPISDEFAVVMLPKNLLVDANGVVVDMHACGERLMERLAEMLGDDA